MNHYIKYSVLSLAATIAASTLSGCIRDDYGPCPPLSIQFGVKDRTYDEYINPDDADFSQSLSSPTDFSSIIPSIYCVLNDENGNMVRELRMSDVGVNEISNELKFDDELPFGKYSMIAWGALTDESKLGDDPSTLDIAYLDHDVYLTTADIDYQYDKATVHADFMRATGLVVLLTKWTSFHSAINTMDITISSLSSEVDKEFTYSKAHDIKISKKITKADDVAVNYIVMPPSVGDNTSVMHVRYFNSENPASVNLEPTDKKFKVKRNGVVVLKHEIDILSEKITVSMLVDGRWMEIHDMGVD